MSILQNTRISTKIVSLFLAVSAIATVGLAVLAIDYKHTESAYSDFIAGDTAGGSEVLRSSISILGMANATYKTMLFDASSPRQDSFKATFKENEQLTLDRLYNAKDLLPKKGPEIEAFVGRAQRLSVQLERIFALRASHRDDEASGSLGDAEQQVVALRNDLRSWSEQNDRDIAVGSDALTSRANSTIIVSLTGIGFFLLIGLVAAFFVSSRGITIPIARLCERMASLAAGETTSVVVGMARRDEVGQMAQAVQVFRENAIERVRLEKETEANRTLSERERIERDNQKAREAADVQFAVDNLATGLSKLSDGDVSYRINEPFTDTLDGVRTDFNNSAEKLQTALRSVAENARGIDAGASEIKSAADDLAKRTEQQAAAVEETAAALEEITTTVTDSTRRAQEAGQLVSRAKAGAERSGEVVRRAVIAMEQIARSANEISNIIGVIDEIAFQTNLLALNAGVEAARAGEAGKGFAVVAQEVRELAQRSANAAKEIKALITTSNDQVRDGVQLVGDTGKALETIVAEVQEINRHVAAIVEAAQEQSSGLQQINTAVNQMDQDTQKNAAMVEESTAASHNLAREVTSLRQLLSQFRLSQPKQAYDKPPGREASRWDGPPNSPVRVLGRKIATAFSGNAAVDAKGEWEEF